MGRPTFKCEFLGEARKEEKGERGNTREVGKGGEGGPHHAICEDKLMQTLLGQFGIQIRIKNNTKK